MKKYYIETYGCKLNQSDSNVYGSILDNFFSFSPNHKDAQVVLINSCGVIKKTERKILKRVKEYKKKGKFVILTGCLTHICKKTGADKNFSTSCFQELSDFLKDISKNEDYTRRENYFIEKNSNKEVLVAIVPLSWGCLGNCSYCVTKLARGSLKSRKQEDVLREIRDLINRGIKEIQLTSQDIGIYGLDRGRQELPELLSKITAISGDFKIRLGMGNPEYIKKILPELIEVYKNKKLYKYFHIPIQSGDNEIIRKMGRNYAKEDFEKIVENIKNNFKDYLIATDVIVGFPGETKKQFENTKKIIKKTRPHIINITRFSARPKTKAAKLKDMPSRIKKDRSREIFKLSKEIREEDNKLLLGKKFDALITEKRKENFIGRTSSYRAIVVKNTSLGFVKKILVNDYRYNYLKGIAID